MAACALFPLCLFWCHREEWRCRSEGGRGERRGYVFNIIIRTLSQVATAAEWEKYIVEAVVRKQDFFTVFCVKALFLACVVVCISGSTIKRSYLQSHRYWNPQNPNIPGRNKENIVRGLHRAWCQLYLAMALLVVLFAVVVEFHIETPPR